MTQTDAQKRTAIGRSFLCCLCGHVDQAGPGRPALTDEAAETGQRRRIAPHVVVLCAVRHVGVEQNGDMAAFHIGVEQVCGGAAAENELIFHSILHLMHNTINRCAG